MNQRNDNANSQPPGDDRPDDILRVAQQIEKRVDSKVIPSPAELNSIDQELDQFSENAKLELEEFAEGLEFLKKVRSFRKVSARSETPVNTGDETDFDPDEFLKQIIAVQPGGLKVPGSEAHGFTKIGRFAIKEEIGQGGFAKVFLAHDPELDRDVAIKIPRPNILVSPDALARFDREARSAALLSHPGIVTAFESGRSGPINFIVYEYCPGPTLAEWFEKQEQPISCRQAALIVCRLADSVEHAHVRGVIHRDLKPSNVLIDQTRNDAYDLVGQIRITDFGLSKHLVPSDEFHTAEGAVIGTPAYMSPEQAEGSKHIGCQTDLYSLGMILCELITGQLPFRRSSHLTTLKAIATEPLPPLNRLRPGVPKDLAAICAKCLAKRPVDRYATAFDLANDLTKWLEDRTVVARQASSFEKFRRWCRRKPALATAITLAFVSLAIGLSLTAWQWRVAQANLALSDNQRNRAEIIAAELYSTVQRVLSRYSELLDQDSYLDETQRQIVNEMLIVHKRLIDSEAKQLDVSESLIGSYCSIARLHRLMGQMDKAREVNQQAKSLLNLATENNSGKSLELLPQSVDLLMEDVYINVESGFHELAESLLSEQVLPRMRQSESCQQKAEADFRWYKIYRHLGIARLGQGNHKAARPAYESGMKYASDLLATDSENEKYLKYFGVALQDMATICLMLGERQTAIKYFESSLNQFVEMQDNELSEGDYRYRIAFLQSELGSTFYSLKRFDDAEDKLKKAELTFSELVEEQPLNARALSRLMQVYRRQSGLLEGQSKFDEALKLNQAAIPMSDKVGQYLMKIRYQLFFRNGSARLLLERFDQTEEAEVLLGQSIEIGNLALRDFPQDTNIRRALIESYRHKCHIYDSQGEFELADEAARISSLHGLKLLKLRPSSGWAIHESVMSVELVARRAGEKGRFSEARQSLIELASVAPSSAEVQYQVARYLARLVLHQEAAGHSDRLIEQSKSLAFDYLQRAVQLGFDDPSRISDHVEWNSLRKTGEFNRIVDSL